MILFAPKEIDSREARTAITPITTKRLVEKGINVCVEQGIGELSNYSDNEYVEVGANLINDRSKALSDADIIFRVRKPSVDEIKETKKDCNLPTRSNY